MSTPLFKSLKENGISTYVFPGASEDISNAYQNDNYKVNFSKFALLDLDLESMNLTDTDEFNTESFQVITDRGDLLVNHLRNYVANHEVVIRESLINNNNSFYDPNVLKSSTERILWKWMRKSKLIEFEPAIPNDEYIDGSEFAIDVTLDEDYFKEFLWKERSVIAYNISAIQDTGVDKVDPNDNILKRVYRITTGSSSNIKPGDRINIKSEGNINIGFTGEKDFTVENVTTDTAPENTSKNNWISIYSDITLIFNNFATASLELIYSRTIQYLGEISSINNVQNKNRSYTEILAYVPNQAGQTPDILFRLDSDTNYSPGLQFPILPSQDQPEIVGGEQADSPIVLNPEAFPGDQYAYFDLDQKYINSAGLQDRKRGDYYGVLENNRNSERVAQSPYVYPEFDGTKLDGMGIDFDPTHYVKMNLPGKTAKNFDDFNSIPINDEAPKDFKFNAIIWYYEVEDSTLSPTTVTTDDTTNTVVTDTETTTTSTITRQETTPNATEHKAMNIYAISFLNPEDNGSIESYSKLVTNGKQDGLSYQFNLNLNFRIDNENVVDSFDENKIYSLFGFDLYNEVMVKVSKTNDAFSDMIGDVSNMRIDLDNLKSLIYTQTDIRNINSQIENLNKLLNLYKTNQISDSESIKVRLDETTNPPTILLESIDPKYYNSLQLPVSLLYNNQNNTVIDKKISVPKGKDFLVNVINDDNSDVTLDRNLNIVLDRDLDFKQTCEIKIYPRGSRYNKKLDISILTEYKEDVDPNSGYKLFTNSFDLPIDNNLNPSVVTDSPFKRWNDLSSIIHPEKILIRKISDNYFIVLELKTIQTSAFKSGDVIMLENFKFVYNDLETDISGQNTITGNIENNEIVMRVETASFKTFFDQINEDNGNSPTHELVSDNFTQPSSVRINTGYSIKITANDRVSKTLNERYLIEVKPLIKHTIS